MNPRWLVPKMVKQNQKNKIIPAKHPNSCLYASEVVENVRDNMHNKHYE